MRGDLVWVKGGEAMVVKIAADSATIHSTVPSPPGSRIEARFSAEPLALVKFKIHGSKRQPDGTYVLEGRPIDLTRELRERLEALVVPA